MITCDHLRLRALALAALEPVDPEAAEARAHARACAGCAHALLQAERMLALLDAGLTPALPSAEALRRARDAVEERMEREAARTPRLGRLAAPLAALGAMALVIGMASHRALDASSLSLAAASAALALIVAGLGVGKRAGAAAVAACVGAAGVAALASSSPGLFAATGLHCLSIELFAAAWPVAAVALARGASALSSGWTSAALAAAGALAGQAALAVGCADRTAGPHLLAFHLGGVVLAALAGAAIPRAARLAG